MADSKPYPHRPRVRHLHSSSRFDRTARSLWLAIRLYVLGHSIITFTEVANNRRALALTRFIGWGVAQVGTAGRDECAVMYRKRRWKLVNQYVIQLSKHPVPSRNQHCYALCVLLEHRQTGQRILVSVCHLPAHVEGRYKYPSGENGVVYRECIYTWQEWAAKWVANPQIDGVMIVADWNLSWRRDWVRTYLNHRFTPLKSTWSKRMPIRGTHDTRLIDFTFTDMFIYRVGLPKDDNSSDHAPYEEVLLLPAVAGFKA